MKRVVRIPQSVKKLMWWAKVDTQENKKLLMTLIFTKGEVKDMRWAFKTYQRQELKDAVKNPLKGWWDRRSLSSFTNYFHLKLRKNVQQSALRSNI